MLEDQHDEEWKAGSPAVRLLGFLGIATWFACTVVWILQRYYATEEPIHSMAYRALQLGWLLLIGLLAVFYWCNRRRR